MEPRISIITLGVRDMPTAIRFYRDGLGWFTQANDDAGWALFATTGTRLSLYPYDALAADVSPDMGGARSGFCGITLAHNTRTREGVDEVLRKAVAAGGTLVKEPQPTDWGGYGGYFADPDGYLWEVAWSESCEFEEGGTLRM
jgi:hypothetical protein